MAWTRTYAGADRSTLLGDEVDDERLRHVHERDGHHAVDEEQDERRGDVRARLVAPAEADGVDDEDRERRRDESQAGLRDAHQRLTQYMNDGGAPTFSIGNWPEPASLPSALAFFTTCFSYRA